MKDNEKALISFRKIVSDHTGSSYAIKARLKSGLIYYNNGQNELALSTFKKVVTDYPNTPESKEALVSIKNIYVDINQVDDYLAYVDGLPFATISISEQDSMSYVAAENLYMDGEYSAANTSLDKYLTNFPEEEFRLGASFYLAECKNKEENFIDALTNFEYVLVSLNLNLLKVQCSKQLQLLSSYRNWKQHLIISLRWSPMPRISSM
ncbi:MAG: tetratricopeptide repeat protein [Bacteroidales bacterium]|nr:tetratricopeptide repeat protein [Bacteroidales bacterium]